MSVLLPKSKEEFGKTDYWDCFFKARGSKSFEWYGEYNELSTYLHKYIRQKDAILILGCGNSTIGCNLYDVGYRDITNIDISQVVIKQMSQKYVNRKGLNYLVMDALNTSFDNESFNVVIDKGTLDALMPDNKEETIDRIKQYFTEIHRVTKIGSRYICISLLQENILTALLDYFPKNNWMFRVVRCFEAEQAAVNNGERLIPVFIVICTKFKTIPQLILEVNLNSAEKMQRFETIEQLKQSVLSNQQAVFICASLQQTSIASENEVSFDLYEAEGLCPKYTVYVVDIRPERKHSPYAVFIVPQGREAEWLFSTKSGRKKLVSMSNQNRLLIVTMHRNQNYGSLEDVQNDLTDIIRDMTPTAMKKQKIPCLSLGAEGVGKREIKYEGKSEMSGGYIVEDVEMEGGKFRRLYFLSNQFVIQSEAKLKSYKNRKGIIKHVADLTYLTCKHHIHMILGAYVAAREKKNSSVAVLGLGGGGLCSFLNKFLPATKVTGIEIDAEILTIATDWFGLPKNLNLVIEINDGLKYIKKNAEEGNRLDAVLFDVDSKDPSIGMSCPPKEFLEDEILDNVKKLIGASGLFILNTVLRDESLRSSIVQKLFRRFKGIASHKVDQELNEIFICGNEDSSVLKTKLYDAGIELNKFYQKHNKEDCDFDLHLINIDQELKSAS